jgi:hypothetical protein
LKFFLGRSKKAEVRRNYAVRVTSKKLCVFASLRLIKPEMIIKWRELLPAPALPVSGSKGMISAIGWAPPFCGCKYNEVFFKIKGF